MSKMIECTRSTRPIPAPRDVQFIFERDTNKFFYATFGMGWTEVTEGADLIGFERHRQIECEGRTAEADDAYIGGELAKAAINYTIAAGRMLDGRDDMVGLPGDETSSNKGYYGWPWDASWFKVDTKDPIRALVKAGALIAAQIDVLVRAEREANNEIGLAMGWEPGKSS